MRRFHPREFLWRVECGCDLTMDMLTYKGGLLQPQLWLLNDHPNSAAWNQTKGRPGKYSTKTINLLLPAYADINSVFSGKSSHNDFRAKMIFNSHLLIRWHVVGYSIANRSCNYTSGIIVGRKFSMRSFDRYRFTPFRSIVVKMYFLVTVQIYRNIFILYRLHITQKNAHWMRWSVNEIDIEMIRSNLAINISMNQKHGPTWNEVDREWGCTMKFRNSISYISDMQIFQIYPRMLMLLIFLISVQIFSFRHRSKARNEGFRSVPEWPGTDQYQETYRGNTMLFLSIWILRILCRWADIKSCIALSFSCNLILPRFQVCEWIMIQIIMGVHWLVCYLIGFICIRFWRDLRELSIGAGMVKIRAILRSLWAKHVDVFYISINTIGISSVSISFSVDLISWASQPCEPKIQFA